MKRLPALRRRCAAVAIAATLAATPAVHVHATGAPDSPKVDDTPQLTVVGQDHVSADAGTATTFTVAIPNGVDAAALADPAGTAAIQLTSFTSLERFQPSGSLPQSIRDRLQTVLDGKLPPTVDDVTVATATLVRPAADQLAVTVTLDGDAAAGPSLQLGGAGIHPVRLALRVDGHTVASALTFVQETDPAASTTPLAVALAVGTDIAVHLDDAGDVTLDDATVAELTELVTILETSAMPVTVHVAPALLTALRQSQPALADRYAAVLGRATIMSAPRLPLDASAAAAADQAAMYTQWLAAGEDMFGGADLPGTTMRSAAAVTTPLSEAGGELLRDLGTRLLLFTPAIYDTLDGNISSFTDSTQLVRVRLDDDRSFDAAIVDRRIGERLSTSTTPGFLDAVHDTVDLLAARQDIIQRQLDPARRTVLIGTDQLDLPDPATLGPLTELISTTPGLSASSVSQIGATTDTMAYDGGPLTVELPPTTSASIADRIAVRTDLAARGDQVRSMLTSDNPLPAQWQAKLDVIPSPAVSDPQVALIADDLSTQYEQIRHSVEPPTGLDFTTTGRTGTLRVKLRNNADFPIIVRVRLGAASNKLTFPAEENHVLDANTTTELKFDFRARSNGRFAVYLTLLAPNDLGTNPNPLQPPTRFTATVFGLSGLGNLVTGAALLVLLSWWLHHIRASRRRKAGETARRRHPTSVAGAADPTVTAGDADPADGTVNAATAGAGPPAARPPEATHD
ncbi:MAG: DUF6049 family protein [Ilumatobacteraceae bacterium]